LQYLDWSKNEEMVFLLLWKSIIRLPRSSAISRQQINTKCWHEWQCTCAMPSGSHTFFPASKISCNKFLKQKESSIWSSTISRFR
jgi:hypothetical protein